MADLLNVNDYTPLYLVSHNTLMNRNILRGDPVALKGGHLETTGKGLAIC